MKQVWAIARMTFAEGVRMRIVLVFLFVLGFAVLRLPFALRGDETLSGRLQTFLSYSLGALSVFLGLATVFLSCSTLSGELRTRSLHLIVTKPVTRFEVLAGKWLGVNLLNVLIVALSGLAIYGFSLYIKTRPEQFARDRLKLDDTIWTARWAAQPDRPDFGKLAGDIVAAMEKDKEAIPGDRDAFIAQRAKELEEEWKRVPPDGGRKYEFAKVATPETAQTVFQLSFKARGIPLPREEKLYIQWVILDPETEEPRVPILTEERHGERHDMLLGSRVVKNGKAVIAVFNPTPYPGYQSSIYFEGDDSLILMYKVGSFEANYAKALTLILCRVAFLAAVGLFFSTFATFPVASFCALSIYLFCLGIPWWLESIGANLPVTAQTARIDPYGAWGPYVRGLLVPMLKFLLPDFIRYDGVGQLIEGRYIDSDTMLRSAAHTLAYGIGLLAGPGWLIFRNREVAEVIV